MGMAGMVRIFGFPLAWQGGQNVPDGGAITQVSSGALVAAWPHGCRRCGPFPIRWQAWHPLLHLSRFSL